MPPARDDLDRNATSRAALIDLVRTISGTDLNAPLGDDWTVKVALAHLAFWDHRQRASLRQHLLTGTALEDSDDVVTRPSTNSPPDHGHRHRHRHRYHHPEERQPTRKEKHHHREDDQIRVVLARIDDRCRRSQPHRHPQHTCHRVPAI